MQGCFLGFLIKNTRRAETIRARLSASSCIDDHAHKLEKSRGLSRRWFRGHAAAAAAVAAAAAAAAAAVTAAIIAAVAVDDVTAAAEDAKLKSPTRHAGCGFEDAF